MQKHPTMLTEKKIFWTAKFSLMHIFLSLIFCLVYEFQQASKVK